MKSILAAIAATILAASPVLAASTAPQQQTGRIAQPVEHEGKLEGTAHKGKRCTFSKKEAIVVAVGWFLGGIPGAILTPIACKRDLL